MKKLFLVMAAAAATTLPAHAAELKLGFVNLQEVVANAPQTAQAEEKLQQEFAPQRRDIISQQNDLKSLQEKYQKDGAVMSESERANMERRLRDLQRDLQRAQQQYSEDVQIRRNEELGGLQRLVVTTVQDFAKEQGFDLIFVEGVAYASDAVNVTAQVVERVKNAK